MLPAVVLSKLILLTRGFSVGQKFNYKGLHIGIYGANCPQWIIAMEDKVATLLRIIVSSELRNVVTPIAPLSQQAGYYCSVCKCVVKDSANYLDHINGKNHISKSTWHVYERASLGQVFHKTIVARSSVFPVRSYGQPEDSFSQDVGVAIFEKSMKKHTDNVMRFLEGISSRLSQLELYCYNLLGLQL